MIFNRFRYVSDKISFEVQILNIINFYVFKIFNS